MGRNRSEPLRGGGVYAVKVKSLYFSYVPLEDNTFLAVSDEEGVVVRLTHDISTESELLGKRFFIVPSNEDPYKIYGIDPSGNRDEDQDVFYKYLTERGGE